jgi:hypothetical protein
MSNIKVTITYDTTTPESAEHGEFADHGFYGRGGWKFSIADDNYQARVAKDGHAKAFKDMQPDAECFDSVESAVDYIQSDGPFEASDSAIGEGTWLTQISPLEDRDFFEKGESTRLSYHVKCDDPTVVKEVISALV